MNRLINYTLIEKLFWGTILLLLLSSPLRGEIVDQVVAIVNNEIITFSELVRIAQVEYQSADQTNYREILQRMIDQKLIDQDTREVEVNVSEKDVDATLNGLKEKSRINDAQLLEALKQQGMTLEEYRKEVRTQLRRSQAVSQRVRTGVNVTDKEIKEYYQNHSNDFFEPAQVKIEQIFFPFTEETTPEVKIILSKKAAAAEKKVRAGEDFKKVSQAEDKSSYDVSYFKKGDLMAALDGPAFTLAPGEASNLIETNKGYFIIRILERTAEKTKKMDEARKEIDNQIIQEKMDKKFQDWMRDLRNKAYIEIKL